MAAIFFPQLDTFLARIFKILNKSMVRWECAQGRFISLSKVTSQHCVQSGSFVKSFLIDIARQIGRHSGCI